jgi:CheY-like chemotaxis protein
MRTLLENISILLVDDDPNTRDLLRFALEQSGASVVTADSVRPALEAFRRCPPHAVISDIRLANSDGYELLKAIQELNVEYRGSTPVIAVTGFASPEDEQRAIAAGFKAYIPKPFDPVDVVNVVAIILSGPADQAA